MWDFVPPAMSDIGHATHHYAALLVHVSLRVTTWFQIWSIWGLRVLDFLSSGLCKATLVTSSERYSGLVISFSTCLLDISWYSGGFLGETSPFLIATTARRCENRTWGRSFRPSPSEQDP